MWNGPLRYIVESYLSISLSFLSWYALPRQWDQPVDIIINLFCILNFCVYILMPMLTRRFFIKNFEKFKEPDFRARFKEVLAQLSYRYDTSPNFFTIFCYRRLVLVFLIVYLQNYPAQQV